VFVAVLLLQAHSTSNNAKGDKQVICFQYSFVLWWYQFYHINMEFHCMFFDQLSESALP